MTILVTGAAGFIGSHFVLRHKELFPDDTIIGLDKLTYAADKSYLDPIIDRIRFIQGDIADVETLSAAVEKYAVEVIVNFAAETHVDRSIENPIPFIHSNILGTQALIEVCRRHPDLRLLHVSTDEVYGDIADNDPLCTVESALWPSSPYAATKASSEMLLIAAMRTYKINVCISRCTNNYGPHQYKEKLIPKVIRNAVEGTKIPVYAQGKNKRDWLYVTDHCDALELMLKTPWVFSDDKNEGSGHIFNVSANDERENIAVVKGILHILGKDEGLIEFVDDRPGHDWRYGVNSDAIRKLGWKPQVSFEEGLKKTVEWYRGKY